MDKWDSVFAKIDQVQKTMEGTRDEIRRTIPLVLIVWAVFLVAVVWYAAHRLLWSI